MKKIITILIIAVSVTSFCQEYRYSIKGIFDNPGYYYTECQISNRNEGDDSVLVVIINSRNEPTSALLVLKGTDGNDTCAIGESGKLSISRSKRESYYGFCCITSNQKISGMWGQRLIYDDDGKQIYFNHEVLTIVLGNRDVHTGYWIESQRPLSDTEIQIIRKDILSGTKLFMHYDEISISEYYEL